MVYLDQFSDQFPDQLVGSMSWGSEGVVEEVEKWCIWISFLSGF